MKTIAIQEIVKIAQENHQKLLTVNKDERWKLNREVKTDKVCKMYTIELHNRVASKGVVEDVEGTPYEILQCLSGAEYVLKLDPEMKEFKTIEEVSESIFINYCRFKGIGPVSDRDFILVDNYMLSEDGSLLVDASSSLQYPYPLPKGVVRGWTFIAGYIIQKTAAKTSRVTYISDADIKGMIPDFVKNMAAKNQGQVASRVNACVQEWKAKQLK